LNLGKKRRRQTWISARNQPRAIRWILSRSLSDISLSERLLDVAAALTLHDGGVGPVIVRRVTLRALREEFSGRVPPGLGHDRDPARATFRRAMPHHA
jgi:hypothetical protein